ncbi:MAG: UPF0146 family protein [Halopenitus sp.]
MSQSVADELVAALSGFDGALEVGIGRRTTAATQLAAAGTSVVAIDVDSEVVDYVGSDAVGDVPESVAFAEADVRELAGAADPVAEIRSRVVEGSSDSDASPPTSTPIPPEFDLVYALNLPAELQRPTVALAERLDAVCAFTTLGFEEPVVNVSRKTVGTETLYVASDRGKVGDAFDSSHR